MTLPEILYKTATFFKLEYLLVQTDSHKRDYVHARRFYSYYSKTLKDGGRDLYNLTEIGRVINRDHSTVISYIRNHVSDLRYEDYQRIWDKYLEFMQTDTISYFEPEPERNNVNRFFIALRMNLSKYKEPNYVLDAGEDKPEPKEITEILCELPTHAKKR